MHLTDYKLSHVLLRFLSQCHLMCRFQKISHCRQRTRAKFLYSRSHANVMPRLSHKFHFSHKLTIKCAFEQLTQTSSCHTSYTDIRSERCETSKGDIKEGQILGWHAVSPLQ
jgi:hypothetical protein